MPYNGTDNDDYANGEGFCCNDGSIEAAQARARALEGNFQDPDAYEKLQFYYHPDHMGSSSYITNLEGEIVQHIEYVPFGEVFFEERNSIWNTPYLFNAKEFDEETGMYYYGARYYDPRLSLWMSVDPLAENYCDISAYTYCHNNPLNLIDPTGMGDENPPSSNWRIPYFSKSQYGSNGVLNGLTFINNVATDIVNTAITIVNAPIEVSQIAYKGGLKGLSNEAKAEFKAIGNAVQAQYNYVTTTPAKQQFWDTIEGFKDPSTWENGVSMGLTMYFGGSFANAGKGTIAVNATKTTVNAAKGFSSFSAFKKVYGSAGSGKAWHHIVEQTPSNISRFGAEAIHNTNNIVKLPHGKGSIHARISGYYSSKQDFTGGLTVREWLSTKSFQEQYDFGIQVMNNYSK